MKGNKKVEEFVFTYFQVKLESGSNRFNALIKGGVFHVNKMYMTVR